MSAWLLCGERRLCQVTSFMSPSDAWRPGAPVAVPCIVAMRIEQSPEGVSGLGLEFADGTRCRLELCLLRRIRAPGPWELVAEVVSP